MLWTFRLDREYWLYSQQMNCRQYTSSPRTRRVKLPSSDVWSVKFRLHLHFRVFRQLDELDMKYTETKELMLSSSKLMNNYTLLLRYLPYLTKNKWSKRYRGRGLAITTRQYYIPLITKRTINVLVSCICFCYTL